ncbi:MAG: cell division protein FtsQ/DivIB [Gammaproteobacteria bacterium]|jgi:cell division protein FtsQ
MARNRKRQKRTEWRMPVTDALLRQVASIVVLAAAGGAVLWGLATALDRPIQAVTLSGEFERVSPIRVEAALGDLRGVGFLSADLDALQRRVAELPWVDEVRVQRRWPGELQVLITEQVPAALWRDSGLLNVRGELFLPETRWDYAELPALSGPAGSEADVARRYLDMRGPLAEAGQLLTGLSLDDRGAWRIELGSGLEVRLGRQQVEQRFRRFVDVVIPLLAAADQGAGYVDMRYSRGFAIAWSPAGEPANNQTTGMNQDV